jgi:hypothetical protein
MEPSAPPLPPEEALKKLGEVLAREPDSVPHLYARARILDAMGRNEPARQAYIELLRRDASHEEGLTSLAILLKKLGQSSAALTTLRRAVEAHPTHSSAHANYATFLADTKNLDAARGHFQQAIELDPANAFAHRGLAILLLRRGFDEEAQVQAKLAGSTADVWPFRGEGKPVSVLLLGSARGHNVPIERSLDDRLFQRATIAVELWSPDAALPPHDVVFNGIGDADSCGPALALAERLLQKTTARVINPPARVVPTGRAMNAARLAEIPGVVMAKTELWRREALLSSGAATGLGRSGLTWPLLVRSPGLHGGQSFVMVTCREDLPTELSNVPGDELFVIELLDVRSADGKFRKYRVMMIDGRLYPLHLAVSHQWKVHYFSADMAENADHRAEDRAFLEDMQGVLGENTIRTLEQIRDAMALDYGGIDFAVDSRGRVVVFEANATMVIVPPPNDVIWAYRVGPVARATRAVQAMVLGKSSD